MPLAAEAAAVAAEKAAASVASGFIRGRLRDAPAYNSARHRPSILEIKEITCSSACSSPPCLV
jgi:hypothetical protein